MQSYKEFLKNMKLCPFCHIGKHEILKQNKSAFLTLAKAPYIKDHLLVIPKRHVLTFGSLRKREKLDILKLLSYSMSKLKKRRPNINVLYREGDKKVLGKSINHMHIHLIPEMPIGIKNKKWNNKKIFSDKEYVKNINLFKKDL